MRFLLALLTLGAAGVGFAYLNQPITASSASERTALRPLFDWEGTEDVLAADNTLRSEEQSHTVSDHVRDIAQKAGSRAASALDEFVHEHKLSEQALDSALKQVQGSVPSPSDLADSPPADELVRSQPPKTGTPSVEQAAPVEAVRDELTTANPVETESHPSEPADALAVESAPEAAPSNTPGASVRTATIVRSGKPEQTPAEPEAAKPQIAQIAANDEATVKARTNPTLRTQPIDSEWKVVGKSVEGRPLHTRRYGDSGSRTLIVAGLDGDDRYAVQWIDQLAGELARRPELFSSSEVLIFRAGNPDGLTKKTTENSHGVLLNRNFPSRRYRPLPDKSSGLGPATEPETRAMLDALYSFHPRRVVHLVATTAKTRINYNRAARPLADDLQRAYGIDVQPLEVEQLPGSIEDFADGTLEAGVLSIRLGIDKDWRQTWPKHQSAILTAVTGQIVDKSSPDKANNDELARSSPEAARSPIPVSTTEPSRRKTGRGYEELPPPPQ